MCATNTCLCIYVSLYHLINFIFTPFNVIRYTSLVQLRQSHLTLCCCCCCCHWKQRVLCAVCNKFFLSRFCLSVHAFWQSHKMELRLVKRSVAITMYSSETSFRVMVQICFIHFFSSFHFSASSTVMQKSLCILGARTVFFWPFKMYFAWSNISCNTCFSIAGKLQECFAKQYICSHICVCVSASYTRQSVKKIYLISSNFFLSSLPICWSGVVEFFGTHFLWHFKPLRMCNITLLAFKL